MASRKRPEKRATKLSQVSALLSVLLFGLGLRIIFAPGVGYEDSFYELEASSRVLTALASAGSGNFSDALVQMQEVRADLGIRELLREMPSSIVYAIFGQTDLTTRSFLLASSLVSLSLIYWIARLLINENAAFLAAVVYSTIQMDIFYYGTLTRSSLWFPLALLLAYVGLRQGRHKKLWIVILALLSLALLLLVELWLGIFTFGFIAVTYFDKNKPASGFFVAGFFAIIAFGLAVLVHWQQLPAWRTALLEPGTHILLALFGISLIASLWSPSSELKPVYLWSLSAATAGLASLAATPNEIAFNVYAPLIMLVFVGFSMISGWYLARIWGANLSRTAVIALMASVILLAYLGLRSKTELIPSFDNFTWLGSQSIFLLSNIASGVFIFFIVASAIKFGSPKSERGLLAHLILALFLLAMLSPIWEKVGPYRMLTESARSAVQGLGQQNLNLTVFAPNPQDRGLLSYYRELFLPGDHGARFPIAKGWETADEIDDGYIVVREGDLPVVPESWWKMTSAGWQSSQTRFAIYRSLTREAADDENRSALSEVYANPTAASYSRLYGALINVGDLCNAYAAWITGKDLGSGGSDSILVRPDLDCFTFDGKVDVPEFRPYRGYSTLQQAGLDEKGETIWQFRHRYLFFYDARALDVSVELAPDSFYLYSAHVRGRGREAFYSLYWRIGETEQYLDKKDYPEWEHVGLLVFTGGSSDDAVEMKFSPVLVDNYGIVFFSGLEIWRVLP